MTLRLGDLAQLNLTRSALTQPCSALTRSASFSLNSLGTKILAMNMVITFELLPVITLMVKSSKVVNAVAKIAFRERRSLVRF